MNGDTVLLLKGSAKIKFTNEEKQAILERYISKSESPTSITSIPDWSMIEAIE